MNQADLPIDQIDADSVRAAAVASGLFKAAISAGLERGESDHRIDQVMVICIINWTHEDGVEREDVIIGSETKRRYIQRGILYGALDRLDERE